MPQKLSQNRNPFRVQFRAWGDALDIEGLLGTFGEEGYERGEERKGQRIRSGSGERIAKTGRLSMLLESQPDLYTQAVEKVLLDLTKLPKDFRDRFNVETARLDCQIYHELAPHEAWEVWLEVQVLSALADRGIEVRFGVMP